jgi:hypothetical protein
MIYPVLDRKERAYGYWRRINSKTGSLELGQFSGAMECVRNSFNSIIFLLLIDIQPVLGKRCFREYLSMADDIY